MPKIKDRRFTAHLPPSLADRVELCARYSGKCPDTIVSDLVAACMEDLTDIESDGAEGVEKLLQLLQQANVEGYAKARKLVDEIVGKETFWDIAEELERLPSQRSENEQRQVSSIVGCALGGSESSHG